MSITQGVNELFITKRQSAKGSIPTTSGAQVMRRESANLDLDKSIYDADTQMRQSRQTISSNHGVELVSGQLQDILSPLTHSDYLSQVLGRDLTATSNITGLSITIASGSGSTYTVTRASGSWVTDGVKVGMVGRLTAGSFATGNLNNNLAIISMTATVLTVQTVNGSALTAEGPVASATFAMAGKSTYIPSSGHTKIFNYVEHWQPDIPLSTRSQDVVVSSASINIPGDGNNTISFALNGLKQTDDSTQFYVSPTAETTTNTVNSSNGVIFVNGTQQVIITDLTLELNAGVVPADGVVGSKTRPDFFGDNITVTGSLSAYFDNGDIEGYWKNETEVSMFVVLADSSLKNANFISFYLPRVKVNASTGSDAKTGKIRQYTLKALEYNGSANGVVPTTIFMQDSAT